MYVNFNYYGHEFNIGTKLNCYAKEKWFLNLIFFSSMLLTESLQNQMIPYHGCLKLNYQLNFKNILKKCFVGCDVQL